MAIISVEVPDSIAKKIKPFTVIKYEVLLSYNIDFDFEKEYINQDDFLSHLKFKHG